MTYQRICIVGLLVAMTGCLASPTSGEGAGANEAAPSLEEASQGEALEAEVSAALPSLPDPSAVEEGAPEDTSPRLKAEAAFRNVGWEAMQAKSEAFKACAGKGFATSNAYFEAVAERGAEGFELGQIQGKEAEEALGRCVQARMREVLAEVQGEAPEHVERLGFSVWLLGPQTKGANCSGEGVICAGLGGAEPGEALRTMTFGQEAPCPHSGAILDGGEEVFEASIECHTLGQGIANAGGDAMPLGAQAWVSVRYDGQSGDHMVYGRYTDERYREVASCLVEVHRSLALEGEGNVSCQQNLCSRLYSFARHPVLSLMVH
ncbi:hypothetical protein DL240_18375 [Lujinxingia litoralis]|uniref:Uncharacterized protein n=1 Tax=Lujinxingia litoralis TaxID=2211119 RepID=A0A328C2N6_9DELT|nr:hypothetical protein [Lujinxingia litoralis]RAL20185.1 hypothetical protein DL240_18375 [Lujinxingia litoralis]